MTASRPTPIRIATIDDHAVIRDGIAGWCRTATPPIYVVADYTNPHDFLADHPRNDRAAADVVILDLQFEQNAPDLRSLETLCNNGFRIVVYSQHTNPALVLDCLDLGAVTYLSKGEAREHLVAAIHAANDDRPYLSPTMAKAMSNDTRTQRPSLSPREREVLLCWFQTESKILTGQRLFITAGTVNTHLGRIRTKYAKAGRAAPTKAALVARAIQDGIITAEDL